ncbi:hypothetical protein [Ruminococcus sp. 5_1_39BFAA]|uniref:hypothetical protein n=1 Tax=Ruminococcus sp. 5_1_39BFAA TaxID=457412 RepID=UPI003563C14A
MSNTPYDDVFRTLLNDCSSLALPLLNEVFGEHYTGKEKIVFSPNEHFINQQDGEEDKRITDTCFVVVDEKKKRYHWECQSTEDKRILVRIFEYDAQIALDEGEITGEVLEVEFPNSAVLSLRGGGSTPENMKIRIKTPGGTIEYPIPVMKMRKYTLDEIFEKELLFLLPFYIFTHESRFSEYERDEEKLELLKEEYISMVERLDKLCLEGKFGEYEKCAIIDMSKKVAENIASGYERVRKGVKEIMGGQILDYEAKTILKQGIEKGREEGIERGIEQGQKTFADLTAILLEENRLEDLKRATQDAAYRKQLCRELHIGED